uniref:Uncharacterized protein n=1 Tax=Anguilla anguilla TaxID=7936 RepID=A0A0E9SMR3_ANGAN
MFLASLRLNIKLLYLLLYLLSVSRKKKKVPSPFSQPLFQPALLKPLNQTHLAF